MTREGIAVGNSGGWPTPSVYVQWKGTDVCLDFHCICGADEHVDGDFVYGIRCTACGRVYTMPDTLVLVEGEPASGIVVDVPQGASHD